MGLARPVGGEEETGTGEFADGEAQGREIRLGEHRAVRGEAGHAAGRAGGIDFAVEHGALARRGGQGEGAHPFDRERVAAAVAHAPDFGLGAGFQHDQLDKARFLAQQAEAGNAAVRIRFRQRQVEDLHPVAHHGIAEDAAVSGEAPEDQRQMFAAQLEVGRGGQSGETGAGVTALQLAIKVEHVQPAFARGRDDVSQRGRVAVRQEADGAGPAVHTGEGGRHQYVERVVLECRRRGLVFLRCLPAGGQGQQARA